MNINWQEVIVPIVQLIVITLVTMLLKGLPAVLQAVFEYFRAKTKNALVLRFINDLEAFAASMKNTFVDGWKEASKDGKITKEEIALLKQKAQVEIAKIIAHYPSELTGYLKDMADHYLESAVLKLANPPKTSDVGNEDLSDLSPEESALANGEAQISK